MKPSLRKGREGAGLTRSREFRCWEFLACTLALILALSLCLSAVCICFVPILRRSFSYSRGYATGSMHHVLMICNKGKRAASPLPILSTILGKTGLFFMGIEHATGSIIEERRVRYFDWLFLCLFPTSRAKKDRRRGGGTNVAVKGTVNGASF